MDKTTKKNFQAREYIMNIILSSPIGTKLPSERELMSHPNFSRPTIQHAIDDLLLDGYLYRVKRQGTFIANNFRSTNLNRISSFNEAARELGVQPDTELLDQAIVPANEYMATKLDCPMGTIIHFFLRLRKHAGIPVILEYSYFTDFAVSNITKTDVTRSIYRYIEQIKGLSIGSSSVTIEAVLPEAEIAELLEVPNNEPLLQLERSSRLQDGHTFEYTNSFVVSRYNKFSVTSVRRG